MKALCRLSLFFCLASIAANGANDFQRIAPKPVTPVGPAGQVTPATTPVAAKSENQVLIPKLKGLLFVPTPAGVDKQGVRTPGIVLRDVVVPAEPEFRALVSGYLGKTLTRAGLNSLITDVIFYYRHHDRPVVDVIAPEQEVTRGVLQLVVLEGKAGTVTVKGNRWFSSSEISDGIEVRTGDPLSGRKLQGDLDWINENPFRSSDLVYHPGDRLGYTNLVLETHDRFPLRPYVGYEDSGNIQTGLDRYLVGFNYGDLFGIGQQLNYQYTTSGNGDTLRAHSGSYIVPLPWHNSVTFFGSYVDTKGNIPPLIGLAGRTYQVSGRYNVPLPSLNFAQNIQLKSSVSAGFDYKYNKNSLEFGGLPAPGTLYEVGQFVLSYDGTMTDPYGQTTLSDQLYLSPGGLGLQGNNNDTSFNAAHAGATSDYVYNLLTAERLTRLPVDFSLILRGSVQSSNGNLSPSEQFGLGGSSTVRGYDDREVNTDEGYNFTTEVRTPPVSFGETFGYPQLRDQLQFLGFWDYGVGSNYKLLPGEPSETSLSSVGGGLRYNVGTYVSVRFDYGFQLIRTNLDTDHGSRGDVGVVVSY